jgi:hypothetical protein
MEVYRRLTEVRTADELKQLEADVRDAFGPYPAELQTLLDLAEIRVLAARWRVRTIMLKPPDLVFTVDDLAAANALFEGAAGSVRWPDPKTVHWRPPANYLEMPTRVTILRRLLQRPVPEAMLSEPV